LFFLNVQWLDSLTRHFIHARTLEELTVAETATVVLPSLKRTTVLVEPIGVERRMITDAALQVVANSVLTDGKGNEYLGSEMMVKYAKIALRVRLLWFFLSLANLFLTA
jgi:hypothetical protein